MQRCLPLCVLAIAAFAPAAFRLTHPEHLAGLVSDLALGLTFFLLAWTSPRPLRVALTLLWGLFQVGAQELLFSLQRYPVWQDLHYLTDPGFVKNTTDGMDLSSPLFAGVQLGSVLLLAFAPLKRLTAWRSLAAGALAVILLLTGHELLSQSLANQPMTDRYNPLHWFVLDAALNNPWTRVEYSVEQLPLGLIQADLQGKALIEHGKAKNVLIVILEGIPGLYIPEIREALGLSAKDAPLTMQKLDAATQGAMLVPDFTVHSHQTIRGLYALLCGDFSKFSWDTPKAFELQAFPDRAKDCLPAQMRARGWSTHYLQAAGLGFMSKDRVMAQVGFDKAHGVEWFQEPNSFPFEWGKDDRAFFKGARRYIKQLRRTGKPWMLTLLTVGTHQPYAVPDEIADQYPSRKDAAVALLDEAVGVFLNQLKKDGVLRDTLVIVTSDESHGAALAPWVSAWGLGMVLAPEGRDKLPRIKRGGYGNVDLTASVLDYFSQPVPLSVVGRSLFRDYQEPREMLSFTASALRRHTADNMRLECTADGRCWRTQADSLLGQPPEKVQRFSGKQAREMAAIARALDNRLHTGLGDKERLLCFGEGEKRTLNAKPGNDWSDNLIGAQYLDFPENSDVEVRMRLTMLKAPPEGVQLRLAVKEWEYEQKDVVLPVLPALHSGEVLEKSFSFHNRRARRSFSFFLVGTSPDAVLQIDRFDVIVRQGGGR